MVATVSDGPSAFRCQLSQEAVDAGVHPVKDPHGYRLGWGTETLRYIKVKWDGNVTVYSYAKRLIARNDGGR